MDKVLIKRFFRMKLHQQIQSENVSSMFLYGSILMASVDYIGILDYIIKAVAGGLVWFLFKIMQDYFSPLLSKKAHNKIKEKERLEKEKLDSDNNHTEEHKDESK